MTMKHSSDMIKTVRLPRQTLDVTAGAHGMTSATAQLGDRPCERTETGNVHGRKVRGR